ncbi:MAG: AMP-binding protein, partial [Deltaproteobacteria bacterium]|nr:AMP-binding protein [Deltaproteobacteria bacterium]
PEEFCKLLLTNKITVLNQTPTAFANLSEVVSHKKQALSVRYVIFGGEALNPSKLRFWYNTFSDCKLINMFGITETTVHVTYKEITEDEICNNISNIGKPIPTLTTYVLDRNQNLLPIGVIGEICVAGEGVCRGYLNNKELTSLKFIENPFNKDEILYRSGDKAFINSLGELVYLGRFDNQIQLRGFRVELGEIENSLLQHTDINSVVVILYQYMTGDKDLTAYYVSGREFDISEIRAYLKLTLPDYMIPSYFVRMNLLPLNSNGKIDKKILPDPKVNGVVNNLEIIAPRNEIEEELVNIWKDILGIKSIGIEDDFFNLGGNSLKAVTMVYKIKKVFNDKEIPLIDFYKNPVIKNLSELISGNSENDLTIIKAIKKNNNSEINLICIPYAGADASIYFNLAEDISKLTEKISIYGINSISNNLDGDGDGDGARLQDIKTLANNCFNEINGNIKGPIIIYGHCIGSALSVEISHLLEEADMEVKALCLGASIPLRRRSMKRQNPMLKMSDYDIYEILKEWGLPDIELDAEDLSYLIRNFKKDIKMYRDYGIIKRKWKLNIPLYCIVSKDDPLTIGYKRKYKNWETYTTNNITLIELEDCSHYFINEIPETLAGLLVDISRQ